VRAVLYLGQSGHLSLLQRLSDVGGDGLAVVHRPALQEVLAGLVHVHLDHLARELWLLGHQHLGGREGWEPTQREVMKVSRVPRPDVTLVGFLYKERAGQVFESALTFDARLYRVSSKVKRLPSISKDT